MTDPTARTQNSSIHCLPISHAGKLSLGTQCDMPRVVSSGRPCGNKGLGQKTASPTQGTSEIDSSHQKEQEGWISPAPHTPGGSHPVYCDLGVETGSYLPPSPPLTLSLLMEMNCNHIRSLHSARCSCALECSFLAIASQPTIRRPDTEGHRRAQVGPGCSPEDLFVGPDAVLYSSFLPMG